MIVAALVAGGSPPAGLAAQTRAPDRVVAGGSVPPGCDWVWRLDAAADPEPEALAELLAALERVAGLPPPVALASRVVAAGGRLHPAHLPWPRWDKPLEVAAAARGLVPLRAASPASLLLRPGTRPGPFAAGAYLVPGSVVRHGAPAVYDPRGDLRLLGARGLRPAERVWLALQIPRRYRSSPSRSPRATTPSEAGANRPARR